MKRILVPAWLACVGQGASIFMVVMHTASRHRPWKVVDGAPRLRSLFEVKLSHMHVTVENKIRPWKSLANLLLSLNPACALALMGPAVRFPSCAEGVIKLMPGQAPINSPDSSLSSPSMWPRFLFLFRDSRSSKNHFPNFRHDEVRGAAATLGIDPQHLRFKSAAYADIDGVQMQSHRLQWVSFPSAQDASAVAARCSLVKCVVDVWASACFPFGPSTNNLSLAVACADERWQSIADAVQSKDAQQLNEQMIAPLRDESWRCRFVPLGLRHPRSMPEKIGCMEKFAQLLDRLPGRVDLNTPQHVIALVEDFRGAPGDNTAWQADVFDAPSSLFLGRQLSLGAAAQLRELRLFKRPYLGLTTLPPTVALLMANQARVVKGCLVLDPFCGTASSLLTCAALGARTVGVEIDNRTLYGGEDGRGIENNFNAAGLPMPEKLIKADASRLDAPDVLPVDDQRYAHFDAIITDPPYGVMEGLGRLYVPISERLHSLLCMGARRLRVGGRLVFLMPLFANTSAQEALQLDSLPEMQRCLRLEAASRQIVSQSMHRLMVTVHKVAEPSPDEDFSEPLTGKTFDFNGMRSFSARALKLQNSEKDLTQLVQDFYQEEEVE